MAIFDRFKKKSLNDALWIFWGQGDNKNKLPDNETAIEKSHLIYRAVMSTAQRVGSLTWHIRKNEKINENVEKIFRNANSYFTFEEILEKTVSFQSLLGYHVWYVENKIISPIDSNLVKLERNNSGQYRVTPLWKYNASLNQENFVIFPNFTPFNTLNGISELKTCVDIANLGENAITLTNNIMSKGGLLTGILRTDQNLTQEQMREVKTRFDEKYAGINNSGGVMVAGHGIEWQKIGLSPSDFSALDLMKITIEGVSIAFGVPKIYLMDTESVDYANSKTQERMFYQITIKPKADRIADRINRFVLPLMGYEDYEFYFDWESVEALQPDKLLQAQVDEVNVRSGIRLINEIRIRDNLPETDYGWNWYGSAMNVPLGSYKPEKQQDEVTIKLKSLVEHKKEELARETFWKSFIAKTEPEEKRLIKEINKWLNELKKDLIDYIESGQTNLEAEAPLTKSFNFDSFEKKLIKMLKPFEIAFMQQRGDEIGAMLGISFDLQRPEIMTWLDWKLENSASEIIRATREAVEERLREGLEEGEGIPQLADRIRDLFEETYKHRAETISRTEVISANNKASLEAMRQAGIKTKTWLTAIDERTREAHIIADGQQVGIDEKFKVGGEELEFPGDPNGSPENIINCRCTVIWEG